MRDLRYIRDAQDCTAGLCGAIQMMMDLEQWEVAEKLAANLLMSIAGARARIETGENSIAQSAQRARDLITENECSLTIMQENAKGERHG